MRQGSQIERQRGRGQGGYQGNGGGNRKSGSLRHQTFDSNGPDTRVRGTAIQVYEKYMSLARDAASSGDRVMAENYHQHAEHYYRIIASFNEGQPYVSQQTQQRDAFEGEIEENRAVPSTPPEEANTSSANLDVQFSEMAVTEVSRVDDRRERRDFRSRRNNREGFRQDNRNENRNELGELSEPPAFLRSPSRRPRGENESRDDRRENRRFEGGRRLDNRERPQNSTYSQEQEYTASGENSDPVMVITPAGGGLPYQGESKPQAAETAPAAAPEPIVVEIQEARAAIQDLSPTPETRVDPVEATLPLDLPIESASETTLPKRKRGRPSKDKLSSES